MNKYKRNEKRNYNCPSFQDRYQKFMKREKLTQRERMFLLYCYETGDRGSSYIKAFHTNNSKYAYQMSQKLLNTERAKKFMDELMEKARKEHGIDDDWVFSHAKRATEEAKGEKVIPCLTFTTAYAGLGEMNKKQIPGMLPRGFIAASEIPVIDAQEEVPALPEGEEDVKVHHGDIVDKDISPGLGKEPDPE